ncbi:aldehyde dehydrogenase family protein [Hoeflea alexandrii]|uniref:aldehyde dehydrogenase family protein n=1 Tax=Hoeflea alexandrii TaxID=288436 RepID=UPI0022AED028|nr:aldehyde dehydrogenase family protein [Hoeflea alexandrii]MCZ4291517.1 aldehyde dehydrogenase family protein [Hoeflea alexandrii]
MNECIEVRAPFDGRLLDRVPVTSSGAIENALTTAYQLFRNRRAWLDLPRRIAILGAVRDIVLERRNELALLVASESGKPLRDSLVEIDRGANCLDICIQQLSTDGGHVVPMGLNVTSAARVAFTQYEPIGLVLGIAAFNHPFNLVMHQIAPAVAVGAPAIIKPSPKTPLSCRALLDIFIEAGLPEGWAQMVLPTDLAMIRKLVSDQRIGFVSFIGSAAVGWSLRSELAPGTRCALEHGGIAPVIVAQDADLDDAVPRLARAAFWHAGQACVSAQRLYCHSDVVDEFVQRLADAGRSMVTGDPVETTTDVGPLITHAENDRIESWVREAIEEGAVAVCGGAKISASCYENTVLLNPAPNSKVSRREIFGPVVGVYTFDDMDDAIASANSVEFAFQSAIFTRDIDRAMHAFRHLDGTAIMLNEHPLFRVDWMPFAGARQSGLGIGGIPATMADMRTEKMMVCRSQALA